MQNMTRGHFNKDQIRKYHHVIYLLPLQAPSGVPPPGDAVPRFRLRCDDARLPLRALWLLMNVCWMGRSNLIGQKYKHTNTQINLIGQNLRKTSNRSEI